MSRNFELLRRLDKGWSGPADHSTEPLATAEAPVAIRTPRLRLGQRTCEELGRLTRRALLAGATRSRQVVFAGVTSGTGCTWIASHTAQVLCSETSSTVCLVDASASSATMRAFFSLPVNPEFEGLFAHEGPVHDLACQVTANLWVIPSGDRLPDIAMAREQIESRLLAVRREFDYVLIDAPALAANPLPVTLGSVTDGIVLVVKAGHTRRTATLAAVNDLKTAQVKILGTVLNQYE